jgi:rRNA maturation protein Nop10
MRKIRFCTECNLYTLKEKCGVCGRDTIINSPQRYIKDEEIARYRREIKKKVLKQEGII